ncbi:hypothetical protein BD770DRAFT_454201 [Pilaira anomala]|nr:hypothetical protein BD770DRAFT_454201 [Pilaira anomala]
MNNTNRKTMNLLSEISRDIKEQKQAFEDYVQRKDLEMKEQSELLQKIFELVSSNARSEGIAPSNTSTSNAEVIGRPMARNEIGKLVVKALQKADILEALPACVTAPCEDVNALYVTLNNMIESKVAGVFKDTFRNSAPSWGELLPRFKDELLSLCHTRALGLGVDLSRCEGHWCLLHWVYTKYADKKYYQDRKKREEGAKKAEMIALMGSSSKGLADVVNNTTSYSYDDGHVV